MTEGEERREGQHDGDHNARSGEFNELGERRVRGENKVCEGWSNQGGNIWESAEKCDGWGEDSEGRGDSGERDG